MVVIANGWSVTTDNWTLVPLELFTNTTFKLFLEEIEALGFTVSASPKNGALPYGIVGGRSNARWWLVPLNNRHVATSGLALFQPILPSAKIIKTLASILNNIGLSFLWARNKVYISCPPAFSDLFDGESFSYAFFTGTESPHRKTAIQIMDNAGNIKGFAKVSKKATVKPLLQHEAKTLNYLNTLDLQTALIPQVLFCGEIGDTEVLVTDSLKSPNTITDTVIKAVHLSFSRELAEKTLSLGVAVVALMAGLKKQFNFVEGVLTDDWRHRLNVAFRLVEASKTDLGSSGMVHGDFTPWNTFLVEGKLYVFDWEYAKVGGPMGYDLIHFVLSNPKVKVLNCKEIILRVRAVLVGGRVAASDEVADMMLLNYMLYYSLFYIERNVQHTGKALGWDEASRAAAILDRLIKEYN